MNAAARSDDDELDPQEAIKRARVVIMDQLARGPRTEARLREAMQRRGVPQQAADEAVASFTASGLIDDSSYARMLIASDAQAGGLSRRRALRRMQQRGVPQDIAKASVAEISVGDEESAAFALARRHADRLADAAPLVRRRRVASALARAGYDADVAHRAVSWALGQHPHYDSPDGPG